MTKDFYIFVTPKAEEHYYLDGWVKDPTTSPTPLFSVQDNCYVVSVATSNVNSGTSDYTYTAVFKQENCFNFSASAGVSTAKSVGSASVEYSSTIWSREDAVSIPATYTASVPDGYMFVGWTTQSSGTTPGEAGGTPMISNPITLTLTNSTAGSTYTEPTLYAIFSKLTESKLPEPIVTIAQDKDDPSKMMATIALGEGSPAGTKLRYTVDGTTPTEASALYSQPFEVADLQTVKARAYCTGYYPSDIVSQMNAMVILNDYEDHTWTYYSGIDSKIDGGKYNTDYRGILYSPDPRNVKITYEGTDLYGNIGSNVAVSSTESENVFVYYETLEQNLAAPGEYPYQTISNPFSKRPKMGTTYYGFAGWKIKQGHEYIKREDGTMAAAGAVLNLNEAVTMVNLPYPSVNCTSAEIVLQATWAPAIVQFVSSPTAEIKFFGGTYETNFVVLQTAVSNLSAKSPCTIMATVNPDGSPNSSIGTLTALAEPATDQGVKMEYLQYDGATIKANGKSLYIGRGFTTTNDQLLLSGYTNKATVDMRLSVESGTYRELFPYTPNTKPAITKMLVTLGSDYDRWKSDNSKLTVTYRFQLIENNGKYIEKDFASGDFAEVLVKSGKFLPGNSPASATAADSCFYLWENGGNGKGSRSLVIQGGEINHVCGGRDNTNDPTRVNLSMRMKGGTIHGAFFCGAAYMLALGHKRLVITGGTVEGWVAGGSDAYQSTSNDHGIVLGKSYIYVGGNGRVDSNGGTQLIDAGMPGNVFGAGIGKLQYIDYGPGSVYSGTNVVIADDAYIERGVYGGGSFGRAGLFHNVDTLVANTPISNIYIAGGHVSGESGGVVMTLVKKGVYKLDYDPSVVGGVFGGACRNGGGKVNMYVCGGTVNGGVYGGSNAAGTMLGNVNMFVSGGTIGGSGNEGHVYGGGYGAATSVTSNINMTFGNPDAGLSPTVNGDCFGGAAFGTVTGDIDMNFKSADIKGDVFGGGNRGVVNGHTSITLGMPDD